MEVNGDKTLSPLSTPLSDPKVCFKEDKGRGMLVCFASMSECSWNVAHTTTGLTQPNAFSSENLNAASCQIFYCFLFWPIQERLTSSFWIINKQEEYKLQSIPCESEWRVQSGSGWAAGMIYNPGRVAQRAWGRQLSPPYPGNNIHTDKHTVIHKLWLIRKLW